MYRRSWLSRGWAWITRRARRGPDTERGPRLVPLTATYDPDAHGDYVRHLEHALDAPADERIHNIALTGDYGSGKSSVLGEVSRRRATQTITISLSALGDEHIAATTGPILGVTNRIQKEIVKQLLYRENPATVRNSRFHRISRFRWGRELLFAALLAAMVLAVSYYVGFGGHFGHVVGIGAHRAEYGYAAVYAFFVVVIMAVRFVSAGRFSVTGVAAGPATVTLSDRSQSFFDEYLDEIVYFFEVTRYDTVIFEDIDRFDNPQIFETLRELNTVLNQCKQLDGRQIRFVYALRDSIFETNPPADEVTRSTDDAVDATVRANRTKFFDLIIPIVPFITHLTARDLMRKQMESARPRRARPFNDHVFEVVAEHITDMRQIKNIRNEFVVFEERLRPHLDQRLAGISRESLFALLAYKNRHLADFERIKTGRSQLDDVCRAGRELVNAHVRYINQQLNLIAQALAGPADVDARAADLGDRLHAYLLRLLRHAGQPGHYTVSIDGLTDIPLDSRTSQGLSELRSAHFWTVLLTGPAKIVHLHAATGLSLSITPGDLESALGERLSIETWADGYRQQCVSDREFLENQRAFLRRASLRDLVEYPGLRANPGDPESMNMEEFMQCTLSSDLARQLVRHGYIDWNFPVYVGHYYGHYVSIPAKNFIVDYVDRNQIGLTVPLDTADIIGILREHPEILRERSLYNFSIFRYLLSSLHGSVAYRNTALESLTRWGPDEQDFLTEYLRHHHGDRLIEHLSRGWPKILVVIGVLGVAEDVKIRALNAALSTADVSVGYEVNDWVRNTVRDNYRAMPVFAPRHPYAPYPSGLCDMLEYLDVQLPSLEHLDVDLRAEIIARRLYVESAENLTADLDDVPERPTGYW